MPCGRGSWRLHRKLAGVEGEDRLERALERVRAPDAGRGAVILADDLGEPDARPHGTDTPNLEQFGTALLACKVLPFVNTWRPPELRDARRPLLRFGAGSDKEVRGRKAVILELEIFRHGLSCRCPFAR